MQIVVITGSTRGIGYGLADAFLALGCAVTVSGRAMDSVQQAMDRLSSRHGAGRVYGFPCDVRQFDQVQGLWDAAQAHFGRVDIWINNAGISHPQLAPWAFEPEQIEDVIETNLIGAFYGARVALKGMLAQGFGSLYNVEGMGSDGRKQGGLALYGTTKCGLRYLTDALAQEVEGKPLIVGALRPGMVATNLLTGAYEGRPDDWERDKRVLSILADRVETVAPWMAKKVLANRKNGARFKWLNSVKLMGRFLAARFRSRDVFDGVGD
jgi:NAD(P)-dependent dehydrogenase (short-subunit alcohol dehydrogenase family)